MYARDNRSVANRENWVSPGAGAARISPLLIRDGKRIDEIGRVKTPAGGKLANLATTEFRTLRGRDWVRESTRTNYLSHRDETGKNGCRAVIWKTVLQNDNFSFSV